MWSVYILQSEKDGKYYIGCTHQRVDDRVLGHNRGDTPSTKHRRPLRLVYSEDSLTQEQAFLREKKLKSYKGGEAFRKLLK
jgi:putative endonuclease